MALYPAQSAGVGNPLVPDTANKIPQTIDPSKEDGIGDEVFWVDYESGVVRLSEAPHESGLFNPNEVYGDINGTLTKWATMSIGDDNTNSNPR